jgi:hypothetical protein
MAVVEAQPELGRYDKVWRPHAKQVEFIQLPFSIFEGLYGGAVGGGKSELLYMLPIVYGFHRVPGFHGVLFRETFPQLEASLILRAVPIYNQIGGHYDGSAHTFTFDSGAIIRFSYMENDKHARDHDTNEYQYIGFDELTAHGSTDFRYTYLTSRIRSIIPVYLRLFVLPQTLATLVTFGVDRDSLNKHRWVASASTTPILKPIVSSSARSLPTIPISYKKTLVISSV